VIFARTLAASSLTGVLACAASEPGPPVTALVIAPAAGAGPTAQVHDMASEPPKNDPCDDPVVGHWSSVQHYPHWGQWYDYALEIRRESKGSSTLTGTLRSHYWFGGSDARTPPACNGTLEAIVVMTGTGTARGTDLDFGGSNPQLERAICGRYNTYAPDHFTGTLNPATQVFSAMNNDGGNAVNEPVLFHRDRCGDGE